jgi:hypothetical protein
MLKTLLYIRVLFYPKGMKRSQNGFAILALLLVAGLVLAIAGVGLYLNHKQNSKAANEKLTSSKSKKSSWQTFANNGNEFKLFYPSDWTQMWEGNGADETLLQSYSFGPTKEKRPIYIFEKIAPEGQPSTTVTHLNPGTDLLTSNDLTIGGVLANYKVTKDQYTKQQTYSFWHKKMLLQLTMNETNMNFPDLPDENNTAYVDIFNKIAKSVCMADMYNSDKCAKLADYNSSP